MNRSITQRFLLVIVLVTLMGAGALTSAGSTTNKSAQEQVWKNTAYVMGSTDSTSGPQRFNPHSLCLEEKQGRVATASRGNIISRNMRQD